MKPRFPLKPWLKGLGLKGSRLKELGSQARETELLAQKNLNSRFKVRRILCGFVHGLLDIRSVTFFLRYNPAVQSQLTTAWIAHLLQSFCVSADNLRSFVEKELIKTIYLADIFLI